MIIQYCSDLHLEFKANQAWLQENPIEPVGDILIIAGDTYYLGQEFSRLRLWNQLSRQFKEVYVLPGNHEYYSGYDVSTQLTELKEPIRKNIWLVNNCTIEKSDIRFIFTTLWSRIERHIAPVLLGMADFKRIRYQKKLISIDHYNQLHDVAKSFLTHALQAETTKKQIVVTHHLPSALCNADEFKGSLLNEAFCVDITPFIRESGVAAWIYGHSHRNIKNFRIGTTAMLTNQLGYVEMGEHLTFRSNAYIEL